MYRGDAEPIRAMGWRWRYERRWVRAIGLHVGQHDLPQDESKHAQAVSEFGLPCSTEKCCGTRCRVPRLHWGQDRLSADFCGSVRNALMSGGVAWRWMDRGRNSSLGHCVLSWNSRALRLANVCTLRAQSECGAGSGPTVACIFGWTSSSESWRLRRFLG